METREFRKRKRKKRLYARIRWLFRHDTVTSPRLIRMTVVKVSAMKSTGCRYNEVATSLLTLDTNQLARTFSISAPPERKQTDFCLFESVSLFGLFLFVFLPHIDMIAS